MRYTRSVLTLATLAALGSLSMPAAAQLVTFKPAPPRPVRGYVGINLAIAQPIQEFHDYVNNGVGVNGNFVWNVDRRGIFGLRTDVGIIAYGNEHKRVPLSPTVGGRIMVDLNTTNSILTYGIGPQLTWPSGPVRPYVTGTVGGSYFFTESSIDGEHDNDNEFSTTNFDDGAFAITGAGGFLIPLTMHARTPVLLDFGARFHRNGTVQYLREGGIVDLPNGAIELHPIRSEADLMTYHIGVQIGFR
jgi:hypothetical protein